MARRKEPKQSRRQQRLDELLQILQLQQAVEGPGREAQQERQRVALQLLGLMTNQDNNAQQLALQREGLENTREFQGRGLELDERRVANESARDERRFGLDERRISIDDLQRIANQQYQEQQLALQRAQLDQSGQLAREGMQNQILGNLTNDPQIPIEQRLQMALPATPPVSQAAMRSVEQEGVQQRQAQLRPIVEQMYGAAAQGQMPIPQLQEALGQMFNQPDPRAREALNSMDFGPLNQSLPGNAQQASPTSPERAVANIFPQVSPNAVGNDLNDPLYQELNKNLPQWQRTAENAGVVAPTRGVTHLLNSIPFLANVVSQGISGQNVLPYIPLRNYIPQPR